MTELEHYINSYFGIPAGELAQIAGLFKPGLLKKGDHFIRSGGSCDKLSFVRSGALRIYVTLPDREVTQWISTKGHFVTDLSALLFQTPCRWSIQALSDTGLYTIADKDYRQIGELVPKWHELEKLFIARCFTILEDRIFSHLSMTAEERYEAFFASHKEFFNQVPLQYLASMLGMTPETLSRIRKKHLS